MFTQPGTRHTRRFAHTLGALALAASFAVSGCYESSTDPEGSAASVAALDDLTLSEVVEKVQISDEQAAALAPVLERYRQNRTNRDMRQIHAMQMLADASDVLDQEQMTRLVGLIVEKRQERMQQHMEQRRNRTMADPNRQGPRPLRGRGAGDGMGPHDGKGPRDGMGPHDGKGPRGGMGPEGGFLSQLNLDAEQQAAVAKLRQENHAAHRALFEQFRSGTLSQEQLHTSLQELRAAHQEAVAAILTAEQNAQLAALRSARALKRMEQALERLQTRGEERLALVARILELDEQQLQAARTLHQEGVTALSGVIESLRGGTLSADEARQAAQDLRRQSQDAFRALLTPEQQSLFDALQELQHRGGRRFGPGH